MNSPWHSRPPLAVAGDLTIQELRDFLQRTAQRVATQREECENVVRRCIVTQQRLARHWSGNSSDSAPSS